MLDFRLANQNEKLDLAKDVLSFIDRGSLKSIETQLFSFEAELGSLRQIPNIEKMMESLLEAATLRIGTVDVFVQRSSALKNIERASITTKQRKKLRSLLEKYWGSQSEDLFLYPYLALRQRGCSLNSLLGIPLGSTRAHFSSELCRLRHVLGLADAVHLSMFNLGVNVSFPRVVLRRCSDLGKHRWKPKMVDFDKLFRIRLQPQGVTVRGRPNDVVRLQRLTTKNRRFRLILHYLRVFPSNRLEKEYVKIIKNSLVDEFALQMDQERPDIIEGRVPLFPPPTAYRLMKRFRQDRKGRCRFYKNLLESKSLCAPVGSDMILEAYQKHKASLCRPDREVLDVPDEFLQKLFKYGQRVGSFVSKVYRPYETKLPNTRATIEKSRRQGGARQALQGNLEIQKGPLWSSLLHGATRPEPFVVGLFGPPGSGKTTSVVDIVSYLGNVFFPHMDKDKLSYSRSCASRHWDGYCGQPIVVLDDFGQDLNDRSDLIEFEQLVSTNRYQLPMAELSEKGTCFTSPIIILTSNCAFGSPILNAKGEHIAEDYMAVWRRFHLPVRVMKEWMLNPPPKNSYDGRNNLVEVGSVGWQKLNFVRPHRDQTTRLDRLSLDKILVLHEEDWRLKFTKGSYMRPSQTQTYRKFVVADPAHLLADDARFRNVMDLCDTACSLFRSHMDFHCQELSGTWRQFITCLNIHEGPGELRPLRNVFAERRAVPYENSDVSISMVFPSFPPPSAPRVEAVAIPEPLKVRMITKAESETKVLQPFQKALFEYLMSRPQFSLTHGVNWGRSEEFEERLEWIYRIEEEIQRIWARRQDGQLWLSGDYTSATDEFPMSVTNALIGGILSQIDHEPTKRWVWYEVAPHEIRYPGELGVGKQTSGQLMGSLLSFPLLCFLNDFIVQEAGFKSGSYLINGDDLVGLASPDVISRWREIAPRVGLSLSLGKNFIDPHFCTVNSQLFYDAKVQHTGKVSLSTRYGKTLSRCFAEMQFYYGTSVELRNEFIRRNLVQLRETPRSLSVPVSHGGLGLLFDGDLPQGLSQKSVGVYLHDFCRPFLKSYPIPGMDHIRMLRVPTGFFSNEEMILGGGDPIENGVYELLSSLEVNPSEAEESSDLSHRALSHSLKLLRAASEKRVNQLISRPLSLFPPLGVLRNRCIFVEKGKVGFLKERILSMCLDLLLSELDRREYGGTTDPDLRLLEISQEFVELQDPLFGAEFLRDFGDNLPEVEDDDDDDILHLLPTLEPRIVVNDHCPRELVFLVRGSGSESVLARTLSVMDCGEDPRPTQPNPTERIE